MADRITIVVPDNVVMINGVAKPVDCSVLAAEGKHAVQWDGAKGHIEFHNTFTGIPGEEIKGNEALDSIEEYRPYIDAWNAYVPPPPPTLPPVPDEFNPFKQIERTNARLDALEAKIDAILKR